MRILYSIDSLVPQLDGYEQAKDSITSFTLGVDNALELDLILAGWVWGWGTLAAEPVNLRLWINVLNKLDECLSFIIFEFGDFLLVSTRNEALVYTVVGDTIYDEKESNTLSTSEREKRCEDCLQLARTMLTWTSSMLEKAIHKDVYNSLEVCW
jgi:hypothetical protein